MMLLDDLIRMVVPLNPCLDVRWLQIRERHIAEGCRVHGQVHAFHRAGFPHLQLRPFPVVAVKCDLAQPGVDVVAGFLRGDDAVEPLLAF